MSFPFALPPQGPGKPAPQWVGNGFQVGSNFCRVLAYSSNEEGWSDDLTWFHENTAGSGHFIDEASRRHALDQLRRHVQMNNAVILEVGCSSGFLLCQIAENLENAMAIGSDVVRGPLEKLASTCPHFPLFQFDLVRCPFPDSCVDAVVLLNVLEHIEDDDAALRQVYRILKPGGVAVIEAPAGPHLYDVYDKSLRHFRRYALSVLLRKVREANLQVVERSHLGFFLYPGFQFVKHKNMQLLSEDLDTQRRSVEASIRKTMSSSLLRAVMRLELNLGRWISFPFGIRCLVTCAKQAF